MLKDNSLSLEFALSGTCNQQCHFFAFCVLKNRVAGNGGPVGEGIHEISINQDSKTHTKVFNDSGENQRASVLQAVLPPKMSQPYCASIVCFVLKPNHYNVTLKSK